MFGHGDRHLESGKLVFQRVGQFDGGGLPQRGRPGGKSQGDRRPAVLQTQLLDLVELGDAAAGFRVLESGQGRTQVGFGDLTWGHGF